MEILDQSNLTPSLSIPKSIRFIARNLERISPRMSTLFSAYLFTTPIDFKRPQRETYMYESSQKKRLPIPSIQKEIEVLSYGYSPKKVLLVHGWAGRSTQLFAFADKLLEKGYMVVSFDGPGHGQSTGKKSNLIDFLETVKEIRQAYGPFEAAIGHSFGAICNLNAAARFLDIKTLVTVGSADKVSKIMERFGNNLTLSSKGGERLQHYAEKKWGVKVDDYASSKAASELTIPVLVIHDTSDGDVPVSCAFQIRQNLQNGQLLVTEGLGHTKILRNSTVVNRAVSFIIENT